MGNVACSTLGALLSPFGRLCMHGSSTWEQCRKPLDGKGTRSLIPLLSFLLRNFACSTLGACLSPLGRLCMHGSSTWVQYRKLLDGQRHGVIDTPFEFPHRKLCMQAHLVPCCVHLGGSACILSPLGSSAASHLMAKAQGSCKLFWVSFW